MPENKNSTWRTCVTASPAERLARAMAGTVVLLGLGLGYVISPWFYLLVAFAGLNLLQSSVTRFCPPELLYNYLKRNGD